MSREEVCEGLAKTMPRMQRVEELFLAALELPMTQRVAFLARECRGDDELRRELDELLVAERGPSLGFPEPSKLKLLPTRKLQPKGFATTERAEPGHGGNAASGEESRGPVLRAGNCIGQYELIRQLGCGGMGEVHLARDLRLGRLVALKLLAEHRPNLVERFLAEARTTALCHHENIVVIYEVGERQGHPFMVLEYLEGQTLRQWLREHASASTGSDPRAAVPPSRAVELMLPVVRALAYAHERGIVHRDLKPENIMLTRAGTIKVLDFGIAKLLAAPAPDDESTAGRPGPAPMHSSALIGTLPYMSPEQMNVGAIDHRSDLWAVGIMLFELVTGQHPVPSRSMRDLMRIAEEDTPMPSVRERIPDLGPLGAIIDRCLIKYPAHRTPDARVLLAELEALAPARRSLAIGENSSPFTGLAAFQEVDADRFFGRDRDIEQIVTELRSRPLVAVVGASGVGKSSLVRAGVIPALKRSGEGWDALVVRPGRSPLAALAGVLTHLADTARTTSDGAPGLAQIALVDSASHMILAPIIERLRTEPGYLGTRLRARASSKLRRILVFVDQFEELYTLGVPAEERSAFLACLAAVADDAASPLRVILSMRSDFLDRLTEDRHLSAEVTRGLVLLPAVGREGLREALTQPLEWREFRFESPALVERMVDALDATPGALPLLQFTAARLWDLRDTERRMLTEASYEQLGGVAGALASHADAVLASMSAQDARLARTVFLRLVTPERTRALATMTELRQLGGDADGMSRVLARLIDVRLLAIEGSAAEPAVSEHADGMVELIHESLIDSWPMLTRWLTQNEENSIFLARLRSAARDWQRSGHTPGLLWTGQTAHDAQVWRQRYQGELAAGEEQYLAAVIAAVERQRRLRRRILGAAFVMSAVVAILMSYLTWREATAREAATEAATRATQEASTAQQVSDFLVNMFEAVDPYKAAGNEITARQILDRGAARIDTELRDQPIIRARLMQIMGVVYGNLGHYSEAIALLEQALATRQKLYGLKHLEVAETQHALADVLTKNQVFTRAEVLYRDALDTRLALLGEEHNAVAESLRSLAEVLLEMNQFKQAEPLARRALALRRQLLGQTHPDIADSLRVLGIVLMFHKDYGQAESVLHEAVTMYRQLLGDNALEVAETIHLLAKALLRQEKHADAEPLLEQSLAIQRRILGENHIYLANGLSEQAEVAVSRGEIVRAEELFQKALRIYRTSLDAERMPIANILFRLAQLAAGRGDHPRAMALAQEAVNVFRLALPGKSRHFAAILADLAFYQHTQGHLAEAEASYREVLATYEQLPNAAARDVEATRIHWLGVLVEAGKLDEAASLMPALEKYRAAAPVVAEGWLAHHARSVLGAYLGKTGQPAQAEALLTTAYTMLSENRGARDRHTYMALRRLIAFYENTGMLAKARYHRMQLRKDGHVTY